jgi:hypothetical protein
MIEAFRFLNKKIENERIKTRFLKIRIFLPNKIIFAIEVSS